MQGRCDNDPLDSADNVCEICAGEFCEACLLYPRGQKAPPVCKACALNNSGVRGGVRTTRKTDRRKAKKRRKELHESRDERESSRFVFFDQDNEFTLNEPQPLAAVQPEPVPRRKISIGRRRKKDDDVTENGDAEETVSIDEALGAASEDQTEAGNRAIPTIPASSNAPPTAAVTSGGEPTATELLAKLRENEHAAPVPPPPAPIESNSGVATLSHNASDMGADPFDPSIDPFAMPPATLPPEAAAMAATANPLPDPSVAVEPDVDPFGDSSSQPAPPPPQAEALTFEPVARPSLVNRLDPSVPVTAPASAMVLPQTVQSPVVETPATAPQAAVEPIAAPPATEPPPVAASPMFAEPSDAELETSPVRQPEHAMAGQAQPGPEPQATPQAVQPPHSEKADTDEDGNWVPPALRGMAPKREREAVALPRRRG
jgi:hypothetical protein